MIRSLAYLVVLAGVFGLTAADQARANRLLDWMACSIDITEEIKPSIEGTGTLRFETNLDAEVYNNHNSLKISSLTLKLKGTYNNNIKFTRKHKVEGLELLPGYSTSLYVQTYLNNINDFEWSILEVRGCSS